jgi:hypothetical protein
MPPVSIAAIKSLKPGDAAERDSTATRSAIKQALDRHRKDGPIGQQDQLWQLMKPL